MSVGAEIRRAGTKYETVVTRVTDLIDKGTFRAGDKVPSVRKLSHDFGVSITTILEAYRILENAGYIEARPQSGYYVRSRVEMLLPEPPVSAPQASASEVSVDHLVVRVLNDSKRKNLVQLGAAVPSAALLPQEKLNRCLAAAARNPRYLNMFYDMPPGYEPLRVQIAQRMLKAGCAIAPDEILTTIGCMEALNLALRAVCKPGDTVAVESPGYFGVLQAIQLLGIRALEIPTCPREGIGLSALKLVVEQKQVQAVIASTNFTNPLGSCVPDEYKREMVEFLAEHNVPLIEDDIFGDLSFSDERPTIAKSYDRNGLVLYCSSYSKTISPGYRVGWIAPGKYMDQVVRLKLSSTLSTPLLPQIAMADFLENGGYERHLRRVRRVYQQQVTQMAQAVARYFPEGTRVTRPEGGFVLWIELPPEVDSLKLYEQALQHNITIAPGPMFSPREKYRNFMRLNAAYWSPEVEAAIAVLGRLAK